jgi:hypothetical protein
MSELRQRVEPIRSKKLRDASRGEECTLQIYGCCVGGTETTVLAHLHDEHFGMAEKADDTSGVFACRGCHDEIDGRSRITNGADLTWYKLRALQRTIRRLYERGIISIPETVKREPRAAKPKAERAPSRPIQSRNDWPEGRTIPSRPFDRKKERT